MLVPCILPHQRHEKLSIIAWQTLCAVFGEEDKKCTGASITCESTQRHPPLSAEVPGLKAATDRMQLDIQSPFVHEIH